MCLLTRSDELDQDVRLFKSMTELHYMKNESNREIKALVLVTDYPGANRKEAHRFVHVRNLFYQENNVDVTVLNFAADADYVYEGIHVITLKEYEAQSTAYDILIVHQANIRQHYRFLRRYGDRFPHFILFFHGHEVLRFSKTYPKPYNYVSSSIIKALLRDAYDLFKLSVWHRYIPQIIEKSMLVFVSQWMLDEFLKATGLKLEDLKGHYEITYNCVGKPFEDNSYDIHAHKQYDFVTIRSNLDGSKYCVDIVNELAKNNQEAKFLVVGKGHFFEHYQKAPNLHWENRTLNHQEILEVLDNARCALMPTRTDAQGLMMCEMATYGIPLITSDLPVCQEALGSFQNVRMINNAAINTRLLPICEEIESLQPYPKNRVYFNDSTSAHEVKIIRKMVDK